MTKLPQTDRPRETPWYPTVAAEPTAPSRPRLLYSGRELLHPTWCVPPHQHWHYEMLVILKGHQTTDFGDVELTASAGSVFFFEPGVRHQEWLQDDGNVRKLTLGFAWERPLSRVSPMVDDESGRLRELAEWIIADHERFPNRESAHLLEALVTEFERAASHNEGRLVARVRSYVLEHLGQELSPTTLARAVGMSRAHFSRMLKNEAGETPMDLVRRLRLEEAHRLVVTTTEPLKLIAAMTGLSNEYHLSRLFTQHFGVGARELRHRHSGRARGTGADGPGALGSRLLP